MSSNQLQWNEVRAPRLDIGDLAQAGDTLTSGFDRFAQILQARDTRLNNKADEAGAAQFAAAQSPEEVAALQAKIASGGFGDRANQLLLAQVGNKRVAQIGDQQLSDLRLKGQQHDQGQQQLQEQFAPQISGYYAAKNSGNEPLAAQHLQEIVQGGGSSLLAGITGKGLTYGNQFRVFDHNAQEDKFRDSVASRTLGLREQAAQAARQERQQATVGAGLASGYAKEFQTLPLGAAKGMASKDMEKRHVPAAQRIKVLRDMEPLHAGFNEATPDSLKRTSEARRGAGLKTSFAEGQADTERTALQSDDNAMVLKAAALSTKASWDNNNVVANGKDSKYFSTGGGIAGSSKTHVDKLRTDDDVKAYFGGRSPTAAEMQVALESATRTQGDFLPDFSMGNGYYNRTKDQLKILGKATVSSGGASGIKASLAGIDQDVKNVQADAKKYVAHENALARANSSYSTVIKPGELGNQAEEAAQKKARDARAQAVEDDKTAAKKVDTLLAGRDGPSESQMAQVYSMDPSVKAKGGWSRYPDFANMSGAERLDLVKKTQAYIKAHEFHWDKTRPGTAANREVRAQLAAQQRAAQTMVGTPFAPSAAVQPDQVRMNTGFNANTPAKSKLPPETAAKVEEMDALMAKQNANTTSSGVGLTQKEQQRLQVLYREVGKYTE